MIKKQVRKKKNIKNRNSHLFITFLSFILLIIFLLSIVIFLSLINKTKINKDEMIESYNISLEDSYNSTSDNSYNIENENSSKYKDKQISILIKPPEIKDIKEKKSICIILDDYGYKDTSEFLINLPFHLSVSILPGLPYSKKGFEIFSNSKNITPMLHIPMESISKIKGEKDEILVSDSQEEIKRKLDLFFNEIPAKFANNHMGSKVCLSQYTVEIILKYLYEKGVRFIDSHTINNSLFVTNGKSLGYPVFENNLFLDYNDDMNLPEKEFKKGLSILFTKKFIIIIGHNTKEQTLEFLKKLSQSEYLNRFNFISVRELYERF